MAGGHRYSRVAQVWHDGFKSDLVPNTTQLTHASCCHLPPLRRTVYRVLHLGNNHLVSLSSEQTQPHRRMWVPTAGVHTLTQLSELSVAQNHLTELPAALAELRALRRLDVRCNPLSRASLTLASRHCEQCASFLHHSSIGVRRCLARLALSRKTSPAHRHSGRPHFTCRYHTHRASRCGLCDAVRLAPGLLLGDESSAWHRPTLLRAQVHAILSVGSAAVDGVPAARLVTKLPAEMKLLGLQAVGGRGADGADGADGGGEGGRITEEGLRRAFHAAALRLHPDKVPEGEREAAATAFTSLLDAYRALGRAVAMDRRRLPQLEDFQYAFLDVPPMPSPAEEVAAEGGATFTQGSACAAALRSQLPAALAVAHEVRRAEQGELLLHPTAGHATTALVLALAILLDRPDGPQSVAAASQMLAVSLSREALPPLPRSVLDVLSGLATERLRRSILVEHESGSSSRPTVERSSGHVATVERSSGASATTSSCAATASTTSTSSTATSAGVPMVAVDEMPTRRAAASTYSPTLSMADPFAGGGNPFNMVDLSDAVHDLAVGAGAEGHEAEAGAGEPIVATGAAGPEVGASDSSTSDFSTGTGGVGLPAYGIDDAGWHVDDQGRSVYHRPGGRVFETVVVEYAEGARMPPPAGGFVG